MWSSVKCEIFVEHIHYFIGITTSINAELVASFSATAFVAQLTEPCTRFAGLPVGFQARGPRVAFVATGPG